MSEWLMSIVGIVAAGVLLDIVLPEGDTAKYAKGVYALIVVLVLVAPISSLVAELKGIGSDTSFRVDDSFISSVDDDREERDEEAVEKALAEAGFEDCQVNIFAEVGDGYAPKRVNVDVSACDAYDGDDEKIIETVENCIDCEEVRIYGRQN